jgi:poly-gamma-glutamate synthesis protein (capsule biosynthesis protein)
MRLAFVGDVCPANLDLDTIRVDEQLSDLLHSCDGVVGTLECPLTDASKPRTDQSILLRAAQQPHSLFNLFSAFSLANNHILDYEEAGLIDTQRFLTEQGISFFGAGKNREGACRPAVLDVGTHRVALFGVSQWYPAGRRSSGSCPDTYSGLFRQIRRAKADGAFVVVLPHWGYEYADLPSPATRRLARALVNCGADLVVGSHPHVIQAREELGGAHVYYSLGNFLFASCNLFSPIPNDARCDLGLLVIADAHENQDQVSIEEYVTVRGDDGVSIRAGSDAEEIISRLERISNLLSDRTMYPKAFYAQAGMICARTQAVLGRMRSEQGSWTIVKRLTRIRAQDGLVLLHAYLQRLGGRVAQSGELA